MSEKFVNRTPDISPTRIPKGIPGSSDGRIVVMTSGKGGVGKTASTAAIGSALAKMGYRVCLVDFDVGLKNLDLIMGAERRIIYNMISLIKDPSLKISQAIVQDKTIPTLHLLPTSQTSDKRDLSLPVIGRIFLYLRQNFDWIICDSPAGIEDGASHAMYYADEAIIVTNPGMSSIRDADRIIGMLDTSSEKSRRGVRMTKNLLITRYDAIRVREHNMLTPEDIFSTLKIPILGIIPESESVGNSENKGRPVTVAYPELPAAKAYIKTARRLCGALQTPAEIPQVSIFERLSGRRP